MPWSHNLVPHAHHSWLDNTTTKTLTPKASHSRNSKCCVCLLDLFIFLMMHLRPPFLFAYIISFIIDFEYLAKAQHRHSDPLSIIQALHNLIRTCSTCSPVVAATAALIGPEIVGTEMTLLLNVMATPIVITAAAVVVDQNRMASHHPRHLHHRLTRSTPFPAVLHVAAVAETPHQKV